MRVHCTLARNSQDRNQKLQTSSTTVISYSACMAVMHDGWRTLGCPLEAFEQEKKISNYFLKNNKQIKAVYMP